jgi:O-antigen ligase
VFLLPAIADAQVPAWERLLVILFTAAAGFTPRPAALILVAAIPIGFLAPPVSGSPFRLTEALVVATIGGWSARGCARAGSRRLPAEFAAAAFLAAIVLACSVAVVVASSTTDSPQALHRALGAAIRADYFVDRGPFEPANIGLIQMESLALFAAAAGLAMAMPAFVASFARMLVAGGAAAALLNLQRLVQIVLRSDAAAPAIGATLRHVRINVAYGDVNAAGSFFALTGTAAAGLTITRRRRAVAAGLIVTTVIVAAMWLTGSRAAVAAFLLACVGLLVAAGPSRHRRLVIAAGVTACIAAALLFAFVFPNRVGRSAMSIGWLTRVEMAKVSLRMTADHPWFGVGAGRFYDASAEYLPSTRLAGIYPQENAHNNYLQVLAELGVVGTLLLLWLVVVACRYAFAGARGAGTTRPALLAGIAAFAATMVLGHPLLTPEVCYVLALTAGVATGAGMHPRAAALPDLMRWAAIAAAIALAATVPMRVHAARESANFDQVAWGVGPWETTDDGAKARALRGQATVFVPTAARVVDLPVRLDQPGTRVVLSVRYHGHFADDLVVSTTSWSRYRLILTGGRQESRYEPVILVPKSGDATNVLIGKIVEY